jgi:hypothetical protein
MRGEEPCYDDLALMLWIRPHRGARGQACTQWDQGWWECVMCDLRLPARKAGVLLDAALMAAFPDCDSINEDGIHADTLRALSGGECLPQ